MKCTEQEIQTATQSAIEYFNTTFGLDFSQSEPNQQGHRIFQNASFSASKSPIAATTKSNLWLVNGNTNSRCFDVHLGWFGISFLGEQVLYGTFGGTEGKITLPTTDVITWFYVCINTMLLYRPIITSIADYALLQQDIDNLSNWVDKNYLQFNTSTQPLV